jgi:hypothetical protein
MSVRKRSKTRSPKKQIENPIIEAFLRFKQRNTPAPAKTIAGIRPGRARLLPVPLQYNPRSVLSLFSPYWCDDALIYEAGAILLSSLLVGDRKIIETLKNALKTLDRIYGRNREPVLVGKALIYMQGEGRQYWERLDSRRFKSGFEKQCNGDRPLEKWQWKWVRRAVELPAIPSGRRRKGNPK